MQLLNTTVRQDWPEISRARAAESARLWHDIQILVVIGILAALLASFIALPDPWIHVVQTGLSFSFLASIPLWNAYRRYPHARARTLIIFVVMFAAAAVAWYTAPAHRGLEPNDADLFTPWPLALALLVPALGWAPLLWTGRRLPGLAASLGLRPVSKILPLVTSVVAGVGLALHLLLNTSYAPGLRVLTLPTWQIFFWTLCYEVGLRAFGEELLFRGLAFPVLLEGTEQRPWAAMARVAALNALVYVIPVSTHPNLTLALAWIAYRGALAVICTVLRYRYKSLLPGLLANVAFGVMTSVILL